MKILTTKQLYKADAETTKLQKITSEMLMERAATLCFEWIHNKFNNTKKNIHIFCGVGNNGGDGLVIARLLLQQKYNVNTYVVNFSKNRSADFKANFKKLTALGSAPKEINSESDFPTIGKNDLVIDAIFGMGLTRPPEGWVKALIETINASKPTVISIDVPSGLFIDTLVEDFDSVIKSQYTLTFQHVKLPFLLPQTGPFAGEFTIVNIGLAADFIATLPVNTYYTTESDIKKLYHPREKFSHKGTFGHSLMVGGSYGKIGAIVLASKAALKIGSGLVTAYVPKCGLEIIQTAVPEIMVQTSEGKDSITNIESTVKASVIGIGPGIGQERETLLAFESFLKNNKAPLVIDADALNLLSSKPALLKLLPKNSVLTPHPKEFERLVGKWTDDFKKLELLKNLSKQIDGVVVLKGAHTVIACNDELHFNSTGNAALATAGSGDVLTGIITGLMAQQHPAKEAAILGVYIHGLTADMYLENNKSIESFTAGDIIEGLRKSQSQ